MTLTRIAALAAAGSFLFAALPAAAEDDGKIETGLLDCQLTDSSNLIIVSGSTFTCTFDPIEEGAPDEVYTAKISQFGLDLSDNDQERIRWVVLAPTLSFKPGVLAGDYYGLSADATVGAGVGARVLVGGFDESITLQPVSLTTTEGLGISAGIEQLELIFEPAQ
ncbi:MAG: DUF992 domain-containing protein [Pseudomonadota bacterium]